MSLVVTLPARYAFVALVGASTCFLTAWQGTVVSRYRKKSGIKYPQLYAEAAQAASSTDALKFNCAQRAHQNTLESYPQVLLSLFLTGLKYPTFAAGVGAAWVFGRVLYTLGYVTGDPKKRNSRGGGIGSISQLVLQLAAAWTAIEFVRETL